jgi:hypothetical protein
MFQVNNLKAIIVVLVLACAHLEAKQPLPLASCLSFEMNRIDKNTGQFVLDNVFASQLFNSLEKTFPEKKIDWTAWESSVNEYEGEDGKNKTQLKGCFDVSKIHDEPELISAIMRISSTRFQAAMKYYSTSNSEQIPQDKVDSMIDGFDKLIREPKIRKVIEEVVNDET